MKKVTKILLASALALGMSWQTAYAYTLTNLEVDHMSNPQALDREQPRFSWQMKADEGETHCSELQNAGSKSLRRTFSRKSQRRS